MTVDELRSYLKRTATSERWRVLLPTTVWGALCGIRAAVRGRMKWSDIRPGGRDEIFLSPTITKTNAARLFPITLRLPSGWIISRQRAFPSILTSL